MSNNIIMDVLPQKSEVVQADHFDMSKDISLLSEGETFDSHLEDAQGQRDVISTESESKNSEPVENKAVDDVEVAEESVADTESVDDVSGETEVDAEGDEVVGSSDDDELVVDESIDEEDIQKEDQPSEAMVMLAMLEEQPNVSLVQEQVSNVASQKQVVSDAAAREMAQGAGQQVQTQEVKQAKVAPVVTEVVDTAQVGQASQDEDGDVVEGVKLEVAGLTDKAQKEQGGEKLGSESGMNNDQLEKGKVTNDIPLEKLEAVAKETIEKDVKVDVVAKEAIEKNVKVDGVNPEDAGRMGQGVSERSSARTTQNVNTTLPVETVGQVDVSGQFGQGQSQTSGQGGNNRQENVPVEVVAVNNQNTGDAKVSGMESLLGASKPESVESVDMQENVDRVVKAAKAMVGKNQSVVQIRLDPPELGALRVEIKASSNGITMQLQATSVKAQQLLQQNINELRSALDARGVQTNQIDIQLRLDLKNDGSGERQSDGQQQQSGRESFDDGQQFQQQFDSEQQQLDDGETYGWEDFEQMAESDELEAGVQEVRSPVSVAEPEGFEEMEFGRLDITG